LPSDTVHRRDELLPQTGPDASFAHQPPRTLQSRLKVFFRRYQNPGAVQSLHASLSRRTFTLTLAAMFLAAAMTAKAVPATTAESAPAAQGARPLVELTFDDGLTNLGTLGGQAKLTVYAEGEGPRFSPGPWGDCLDLTAASRCGGTLQQMTPAGGAVFYSAEALDKTQSLTVMLWAKVARGLSDFNSRLLYKHRSWEVLYGRGRPTLLVTVGKDKVAYTFPSAGGTRRDDWHFYCAVLDFKAGQARLFAAGTLHGPGQPAMHHLTSAPPQVGGPLEVGNFLGLRPFKGLIDNLRLYGRALSDEEVAAVYNADLAARRPPQRVYDLACAPGMTGRFRPKASALFFSSRWQGREPDQAFAMMKAFHATHLVWVYGKDPAYIARAHEAGLFYEAATNGLCGWQKASPERSAQGDTTGRQQDFDGNKIVLPHMRTWSPKHPWWTGCHNSPDFRRLFREELKDFVQAGADAVHVDDWEMSATSARRGAGCFCPHCMAGFRQWLKQHLTAERKAQLGLGDLEHFDYREYLRRKAGVKDAADYHRRFATLPLTAEFQQFERDSLRRFYEWVHATLAELSPKKYVPISVNLQLNIPGPDGGFLGAYCADCFDFLVGEAFKQRQTAVDFVLAARMAEALGVVQVLQNKPVRLAEGRASVAQAYAAGCWMRVPWDLYMDIDASGKPQPRYYGKVEDWGDLYDFVHDHAELFDGYRTAAMVGLVFSPRAACYAPARRACEALLEKNIPFALIAAAGSDGSRPLDATALERFRYLVLLQPLEDFPQPDRQAIEQVQAARRVKFLALEDVPATLAAAEEPLVRVEGPRGVYVFVRVKPGEHPTAALHVVNWNSSPDGSRPEVYRHVTLSLATPAAWGPAPSFVYYQPGRSEPIELQAEAHPDCLRVTLPELATWGVLQVRPGG